MKRLVVGLGVLFLGMMFSGQDCAIDVLGPTGYFPDYYDDAVITSGAEIWGYADFPGDSDDSQILVTLWDERDFEVASVITDYDGYFEFWGMDSGYYVVTAETAVWNDWDEVWDYYYDEAGVDVWYGDSTEVYLSLYYDYSDW